MNSIAELVQNQVRKSPFIVEGIKDGLINLSAYARQIIPEIQDQYRDEVKLTSVIMAIQRMDFGNINYESKKLKSLLKKIKDIQVRGHLNEYTFKNSKTLLKNVAKLFSRIENKVDVTCTYTQGVFESTFILSSSEQSLFEHIFAEEEIIKINKKLTAFIILLPPDNVALSGVYYYILKQLAWDGINVVEVVSTLNEFTIVVNEKDSSKCFDVLNKLSR